MVYSEEISIKGELVAWQLVASQGFAYRQVMSDNYLIAFEYDYASKGEGFRNQIARLTSDGRFQLKYLRRIDSPPSHEVSPEELRDVDFYVIMGHRLITDATLSGSPRLKWIGRFGAGFENVDIDACNQHGVLLSNSPVPLRESVTELALSFILAHATRLTMFDTRIRAKGFEGKAALLTRCIAGNTLGLLAAGGIAQRLAELVQPFGMRVLAYDPYVDRSVVAKKGITLVSLEDLLREADYLSCHVPMTKESKGMLTEEHFRLMKPTAYFINTSRGGIYKDEVLAKMLQEGVIAGAAVDVFENEPHVEKNPLLQCPTAIATPHIAGSANNTDAITAVARSLVDSILKMVDGELPDSIVNPEAAKGPVPEEKRSPSFILKD